MLHDSHGLRDSKPISTSLKKTNKLNFTVLMRGSAFIVNQADAWIAVLHQI